jgi:methylmalonyl-CoA/ethylmalonyl-CoA epimerase
MIKKLDHVCLLVKNLDASLPLYERLLNVKAAVSVPLPVGMRMARLSLPEGGMVEVVEPTRPDGETGKALAKNGEGVYHICFEVDDVDAELARAAEAGAIVQDKMSRPALNYRIGFYRTAAEGGLLVELLQRVK